MYKWTHTSVIMWYVSFEQTPLSNIANTAKVVFMKTPVLISGAASFCNSDSGEFRFGYLNSFSHRWAQKWNSWCLMQESFRNKITFVLQNVGIQIDFPLG